MAAERSSVWLLAAVVLTLGGADALAQGRTNLPGGRNDPRGFPGGNRQPRFETAWPQPESLKDAEPKVDDSFFELMTGGRGKGPVPLGPGSRAGKLPVGRTGAGKPAPKAGGMRSPPLDPMKAADQVTATADHLARLDEAQRRMLHEHFVVCDLDSNGWLSLRETEVTLALQRTEFKRTDANQDGRIDEAEFAGQKELLLARLGARPARIELEPPPTAAEPLADPPLDPPPDADAAFPAEAPAEAFAVPPHPSDLVGRFDADGTDSLDAAEVERFFVAAGLPLVPDLVVDLYDRDDSGVLEEPELYPLAWMAAQRLPAAAEGEAGTPAHEPPTAASAAASARTLGGLTHFGRLDPDRDGYVTEAELRKLQSPVRLEIRLRALLSGMDQDGDGRLSEDEFRASMGQAPR